MIYANEICNLHYFKNANFYPAKHNFYYVFICLSIEKLNYMVNIY